MAENHETYNGWSNRETWALVLHINNDEGLYNEIRELVRRDYEYGAQRVDAVRDLVEGYLNPAEYREEFGEPQPRLLAVMAYEVGSVWRVNWDEVVASLLED